MKLFLTWPHVTAWSERYVTLLLGMWLLIISHPSVKFDSHRLRENEFIKFFICYMTLCDNIINRLCYFVGDKPALEPTTLSSFSAIVLAEVEIYVFYQSRDVITWSGAQNVKRLDGWWSFIINPYLSNFGSHSFRGSGDMFVTWLHVTTWSQGHITLLVVVPLVNSPVCQVRWS